MFIVVWLRIYEEQFFHHHCCGQEDQKGSIQSSLKNEIHEINIEKSSFPHNQHFGCMQVLFCMLDVLYGIVNNLQYGSYVLFF